MGCEFFDDFVRRERAGVNAIERTVTAGDQPGPRYSFTQPVCGSCFQDLHPGRRPTRVKRDQWQQCCKCGNATSDGIYIRVDPSTVDHPSVLR